jgi:nucleotide-binding universal stress UspA family protein
MRPTIVVGYDQLPQSTSALDEAAAEADRREGVLTVVHAFQRAPWASRPGAEPITWEAAHVAAMRIAELGAERVRSRHPGLRVRTHAAEGSTAVVLTESGEEVLAFAFEQARLRQTGLTAISVLTARSARRSPQPPGTPIWSSPEPTTTSGRACPTGTPIPGRSFGRCSCGPTARS